MKGKSLLIISCSARKNKISGKVKAWDLYDGVIYRVLKKNDISFKNFDVKILSAKYGIISRSTKIQYYDQLMTRSRAIELQQIFNLKISQLLNKNYKNIYICMGKNYMLAAGLNNIGNRRIRIINGAIGIKMKKLKRLINKNN